MFRKILVANRGEIAIRAIRAARELGIRTVAIYPATDRYSDHWSLADESVEIGGVGEAVAAYLDVSAVLETAISCGVDAVYPGYGFLSENSGLAQACADSGIAFIGPPPDVLRLAGDKSHAIGAARDAGIPTLRNVGPCRTYEDVDGLVDAAGALRFPLFVKADAGGGGRGMRRVSSPTDLRPAITTCMREAEAAFGDPSVFVEEAVIDPRHIEIQILGDAHGEIVHLFDRDCSVQRRHQKVVEIAPAPNLGAEVRARLCVDAVAFARQIGYTNAGTVEFLVDPEGQHVFIEMNPRIQVEHTVTEEVTGVDLVAAQISLAAGSTLNDLGISQDSLATRGTAIQCRVTTEDPANDFRPSTGVITDYRPPGGPGVRVDAAVSTGGVRITPHFDSLLAKLTCRGTSFEHAVRRARRATREFQVRGLPTNLGFLRLVLDEPDFTSGDFTTAFIESHPNLLEQGAEEDDEDSRLLQYLSSVTVNRPYGESPAHEMPATKLPRSCPTAEPAEGSRTELLELGPDAFARRLREQTRLAVTDTTFRDAHQSLLATRLRTIDLVRGARAAALVTPGLLSAEVWGGATYDVALRFLHEDPWQRLVAIRDAMPHTCLQMLLRGRNTVGYTPYPDVVAERFVEEAVDAGIDIFRIFDALNDVGQMRVAIDAVRSTGTAVAEVALCYTGNLGDPGETLYDLDYYLRLGEEIVDAGAHVLAIKDMGGLLRAPAAHRLVSALRERFDLPVHLHTHDTAGGQLATLLAASDAGVDAVDVAAASMAGTTSQPSLSALVAATDHTPRATGFDLEAVTAIEPYWEAVRRAYAPFEAGLSSPTGRVYQHEIPGGQLSNLRQQAIALGLGERFEAIEEMYQAADKVLGRIIKVTPTSKVVGDLALHLVAVGADPQEVERTPESYDLPDSVIGFLRGELGVPVGGWREPFRSQALAGRSTEEPSRTELDDDDREALAREPRATLNRLLFPGPDATYRSGRKQFGDVSRLESLEYFFGLRPGHLHEVELRAGRRSDVQLIAVGEPDQRGERPVVLEVSGHPRVIWARDESAGDDATTRDKADPSRPGHVPAPFHGVVRLNVGEGDHVHVGQTIGVIEAMKMESVIASSVAGRVAMAAAPASVPVQVEAQDLLVVIDVDHQ